MNDLLKQLGEDVKAALLPLAKPLLKKLAHGVFLKLQEAASKTSTPLDDMIYTAAEPAIMKMIDDLAV